MIRMGYAVLLALMPHRVLIVGCERGIVKGVQNLFVLSHPESGEQQVPHRAFQPGSE